MMNDDELLRYSRQIMLPDVDVAGQERLRNSTALIVGLGGLGSPVALYLAAAGVGRLILVDPDEVDLSNLQRQIAHTTSNIGEAKVTSAKQALHQINPLIQVEIVAEKCNAENGENLVSQSDVILDCSDNFSVRFLLNRLSVQCSVPLVSGAAIRMEGQISVYDPNRINSPCYHCLYDETGEEELSCSTNGVLAPVVGLVGSIQAVEAIKVLVKTGQTLVGRLLVVDALRMQFRDIKLNKRVDCPVCACSE